MRDILAWVRYLRKPLLERRLGEVRRILLLKLSKKSLSGVSTVEFAGITQPNGPRLSRFGAPKAFVLALTGLFRQFL
jgi:hypothetical protein